MSPRFSIITVTLNNLPGLRATARSIAAQSSRDFEWIVMDGGSADGTVEFLAGTDADWHSAPDLGLYDAMNKGIARAKGSYLVFLNAGDAMAGTGTLEKLAHYDGDFIYGDALEERPGQESAYKTARSCMYRKYGMFTHHQAMIYSREAVAGLRYDLAYRIAADYKFTAQVLQKARHVNCAPFPICLFESGGVSQRRAVQGRREQFRIRAELGICNIFENTLIYLAQALALKLRRLSPGLYWRFKKPSRLAS